MALANASLAYSFVLCSTPQSLHGVTLEMAGLEEAF